MRICVLGNSRVGRPADGSDEWLDLGSRKPRSVIAALAMRPGRPVPADLLADLVWAGEPPRAAHGALHSYISGLRRVLEPERPARGAASLLETTDHGYVLQVPPLAVDAQAFASEARAADRALAPLESQFSTGPDASWPGRADVLTLIDRVDAALATWAGEPYADLAEHPDVVADRAALEQLRAAGEESRLLGLLALGEHASVLSSTVAATGRHPLRERLWAIHALALTRAGRQADALDALRQIRGVLAEELGLDPGQQLRHLEEAILQQVPALHASLAREAASAYVTAVTSSPAAPAPVPDGVPDAVPTFPELPAGVVGRERERRELESLLSRARAGGFACAQVVGEPGIGKSRLVQDLVASAAAAGVAVGVGWCSQDDGAPPLWPWRSVLRELGVAGDDLAVADDPEGGAEQRAFRKAERLADAVLARAATGATLVVLDDLHWADEATLRALAHLVSVARADAALALVVTRRSHPEPSGRLAAVGDALARRQALRLELGGLAGSAASTLVHSVTGRQVPDEVVAQWHARSSGNPFFLIELARLGATEGEVPATVRDVVSRRLGELPGRVLDSLQTAAVVGRRFHLHTVARANDLDADSVALDMEAAHAAGLVRETGVEQFDFAHALTRDAVAASLSRTKAARRHAQVAHALETHPEVAALHSATELTAELARHWLAAGATHVASAWRTARTAADQARRLTSYAEAMELRAAAVDAHRRMPGADDAERYELLLELAADAAYAAQWPGVERASVEAMSLGRALGSPELVGRAATALTLYCVWMPHDIDVVFEDVVDDLRWALAHLADDDPATRCRLQLALAVELYYADHSVAETRALVDTGMALARRVGDPRLLWWAARAAWMASWTPAQVVDRSVWAEEGLAAAREAGDPAAEAVLLVTHALDALELADRDEWEALSSAAAAIARRERLPYVMLTLHWLQLSLASMSGQAEAARQHLADLVATVPLVAVPSQDLQATAAATLAAFWDEEALRLILDQLRRAHDELGEGAVLLHLVIARCGTEDELQAVLREMPVPFEGREFWSSVTDWSTEAEAASIVGDVELARHAVEVLAPYTGRIGVAGAVLALGPVDGYLALAHATLGATHEASRLADRAEMLAERWDLSAYTRWLRGHRARLGI